MELQMYYKELLLAGLLATAVPLSWADQAPPAQDAQESAAQESSDPAGEGEYMSEELSRQPQLPLRQGGTGWQPGDPQPA